MSRPNDIPPWVTEDTFQEPVDSPNIRDQLFPVMGIQITQTPKAIYIDIQDLGDKNTQLADVSETKQWFPRSQIGQIMEHPLTPEFPEPRISFHVKGWLLIAKGLI